MIVASIRMPPPSAVANILASALGVALKATKERPRISAALVTRRPGAADAFDDGGFHRACAVVGLPHPADDEDLVVHRDAEEEGEDENGHLDVDRVRRRDAPEQPNQLALMIWLCAFATHGAQPGVRRLDRDDVAGASHLRARNDRGTDRHLRPHAAPPAAPRPAPDESRRELSAAPAPITKRQDSPDDS